MNRALRTAGHQQDILLELGIEIGSRPTLAQRAGLIKSKPKKWLESDWKTLEDSLLQKKAFRDACSICLNRHGKYPIVMTTCAHIFHQSCLKASVQPKAVSKCPLCRNPYNVKVTKRGLRASRNFAASQIQAFVRSFLTRRRVVKTLSKRPRVKALRSEYESVVLQNWSKEAISSTSTMISNTDKLLEASEDALAASRRIFSQIKLAPEKESDEFQPAVERCLQDKSCSVCLCPFKSNTVALLSCSHVIHDTCRIQLESFTGKTLCPVCRQSYSFKASDLMF